MTNFKKYNTVLETYRTSKNSDERNTALRSLGRANDPELIKQTLSLPLGGEVKEQDIYLPISALRSHPEGIEALFGWMQENWDELARRLPAGLSMLVKLEVQMVTIDPSIESPAGSLLANSSQFSCIQPNKASMPSG